MRSNHSFVCTPHESFCSTPGTRTETANADNASRLQVTADPPRNRESHHCQFEYLTQLVTDHKAEFWSSSFLQAKGLEGESKAMSVIASNVSDSCCASCYAALSSACMMADCNTTAPSLPSVHHVCQRIRMQRKCHARCRVAVSDPQEKDVVLSE
jgi:hypothetical protein